MYPLNQSPFYKLKSTKKLQKILQISSQKEFSNIINNTRRFYKVYEQETRSKKRRNIEAPFGKLKIIQKRISNLLHRIEKPKYLISPCIGKSYIYNALIHVNSNHFYKLDIKNYFNSVRARKVFDFLHYGFKCDRDIAWQLTEIVTFDNRLPTGAPCSPLIAYYSYVKMWDKIYSLAQDKNCLFTLYVDDLTISGSHISQTLKNEIRQKIQSFGLKYHKEKFAVNKPIEITGILVKDNEIFLPNRKHKKINDLYKELYQSDTSQEFLQNRIVGHLAEAKAVKKLASQDLNLI